MSNAPQRPTTTWWWLPGCLLGLSIFVLVNLNDLIGLFTGQAASAPMIAMSDNGARVGSGGVSGLRVNVQSGGGGEEDEGLPAPGAWPPRDEAFLQAQQAFLAGGDYDQARAVAQEMDEGPAREEAWRRLAVAWLARGEIQQAAELLGQVAPGEGRDLLYERLIRASIDRAYGPERAANPFSEPLSLADFESPDQARAWFEDLLAWARQMSDSPLKVKQLGQLAGFMDSLFLADAEARGALPGPEQLRQEAFEAARRTEGPAQVSMMRHSRVVSLVLTGIASAALGMVLFSAIGAMLQRLVSERASKP